jgi:hypothetical protein
MGQELYTQNYGEKFRRAEPSEGIIGTPCSVQLMGYRSTASPPLRESPVPCARHQSLSYYSSGMRTRRRNDAVFGANMVECADKPAFLQTVIARGEISMDYHCTYKLFVVIHGVMAVEIII